MTFINSYKHKKVAFEHVKPKTITKWLCIGVNFISGF